MNRKRIDERRAIELLKQALNEITHLKELNHDNQEVKLWHDKVFDIIDAGLDVYDRVTFLVSGASSVDVRSLSESDRQKHYLEDLEGHETALKSIIQKYEILEKEEIHSEVVEPQKSFVTHGDKTPKEKIDQLEQFLEELEKFRGLQIFYADIHQDDPQVDKLRTKLVRESTQIREIVCPPDGRLLFEHLGVVFDAFDTAFTKPVPPWSLTTQWHYSVNLLIQKTNEAIGKLEEVPTPEIPKEAVYSSGTPYDAYKDIKNIIMIAANKLIIVDPYVDDTVLTLLGNAKPSVAIQVLTREMRGDFQLAAQKFKQQREMAGQGSLEVRRDKKSFHDRFIVSDDKFFHLGASIKDAGTKVFVINEIEDSRNKNVLGENIRVAWDAAEKVL